LMDDRLQKLPLAVFLFDGRERSHFLGPRF
jgi:hypothetical protein